MGGSGQGMGGSRAVVTEAEKCLRMGGSGQGMGGSRAVAESVLVKPSRRMEVENIFFIRSVFFLN